MGLKCRITYSKDGAAIALNEDGTRSRLYEEALKLTGSQRQALDLWAISSTEEFQQATGKLNTNDNVSLDEVLLFHNTLKEANSILSPSEVFEVKDFMRRNGIQNLSSLANKLRPIFRPDGLPGFDPDAAAGSGLFTLDDIDNINVAEVSELFTRIEGHSLKEDFSVAEDVAEFKYRNPNNKTILGTSEIVSREQIDSEILDMIQDPSSPEEFYQKMRELPYQDLVEQFYNDDAFAKKFMERFSGLKRVPAAEIRGGQLVTGVTPTYSLVKNTILDNLSTLSIEAEIDYITSIPKEIWDDSQKEVQRIVLEIEADLVSANVDIIGLSQKTTDREPLLEVLAAIRTMMASPNDANILAFSEVYDRTMGTKPKTALERIDPAYDGLTIIRLESSLPDQQLFEEHGLIKIGENLYHKVKQNEGRMDLYEYLYQQVKDGALEIPAQYRTYKSIDEKTTVLQDLEKFISSRDTGLGFHNEMLSLYQVAFEHKTLPSTPEADMAALAPIKYNEGYLRTDFVSDFYNYMLREKLANSPIYQNVLSKLTVTDKDITVQGPIDSFEGVEMKEELEDYFRLKKDPAVKQFIPAKTNPDTLEKFMATNFPQKITNYTGRVATSGNLLLTAPNQHNYLRHGGKVYKKIAANANNNVFVEVIPNTNTTYYAVRERLAPFDNKTVTRLLEEQNMAAMTAKSGTDVEAGKQKAGLLSRFVLLVKEKSMNFMASVRGTGEATGVTPFEINLVEFIRSKGINVVTDPAAIEKELKDSMPMVSSFLGRGSSKNITVNEFSVTIRQNPDSPKLKTMANVARANEYYAGKIREGLKKKLGPVYRPEYVKSFVAGTYAGTTIDLPQEVQDYLTEQEVYAQDMVIEAARLAQQEYERTQDRESLEDMGYSFNAMVAAFHGSPYAFDRFSTEAIGTGEGNQSFGWGLYFTDLEDIARTYKAALSKRVNQELWLSDTTVENKIVELNRRQERAPSSQWKSYQNKIDFLEELLHTWDYNKAIEKVNADPLTLKWAEVHVQPFVNRDLGSLYKVSLHKGKQPSEYNWLEWDKPLNEDIVERVINSLISEGHIQKLKDNYLPVKRALNFRGNKGKSEVELVKATLRQFFYEANSGGKYLQEFLNRNIFGNYKDVSMFLLRSGIDGVKYPAESISRGTTSETTRGFNYVVFDENAVTIEERINFIQTPAGDILGFEKKGTIYLDETQLNNVTTLHELTHVFQHMLDQRAAKGDVVAQQIIAKRQELFQDAVDQWKAYHESGKNPISLAIERNNGFPLSKTPEGKESILYKRYLEAGLPEAEVENLVAQVYSDNFLNWFGDWINSPNMASKAVDENGQPLLLYHGSPYAGIDVFDRSQNKRKNKSGIKEFGTYFTDNIELAKAYRDWNSVDEETEAEIDRLIARWEDVRDAARNTRDYNNAEQEIAKLKEFKNGAIYPVFLNLREVQEFDAKGETNIEAWNNLEVKASYKWAKNRDAMEFLKEGRFGVQQKEGVIARNIVDAFVQTEDLKQKFIGDVYLVFDGQPGLIKSATENIGIFDPNRPEIRYQINPMILGERGASELDAQEEATTRLDNLGVARDMEAAGKDPKTIRLATGWERGADNLWRYEVPDFPLKISTLEEYNSLLENGDRIGRGVSVALGSILDISNIENLYAVEDEGFVFNNLGKIRVVFTQKIPLGEAAISGMTITVNPFEIAYQKDQVDGFAKLHSLLLHEVQHYIQEQEGFELYDPHTFFSKMFEDIRVKIAEIEALKARQLQGEDVLAQLETANSELTALQEKANMSDEQEFEIYTRSISEVEARNVQTRMGLDALKRRSTLLAETEDVAREDQIVLFNALQGQQTLADTIGLDLSSPVYAQRPNETDKAYNERLLKEVEAYMVAPEVAEKLEQLRKENPSLWEKIMEFIDSLKKWLKSQIGLSDYKGDIMSMSKQEYMDALGVSILKDDYKRELVQVENETSTEGEARQYFMREADRLPLTLAVFNNKSFRELQGKQVNPLTVQQLLNQTGIKQIEKDLINRVIQENYQGQKRVSYDELEALVRASIMPLERIFTSSYADYGMDNLGGFYGDANTIIFNAPVEHGITGHFSKDFKASGRKSIKYVAKQLNDNTWVAIEEDYELQENDNNIYQFVGTAGTKESVEQWIEEYNSIGEKWVVYETRTDYATPPTKIASFATTEEAEQFIVYNQDKYAGMLDYIESSAIDTNKGMFGHIRVWQSDDVFTVAELQSDYFQKNKAREDITRGKISEAERLALQERKDKLQLQAIEVLREMQQYGLEDEPSVSQIEAFGYGDTNEIYRLKQVLAEVRNIRDFERIDSEIEELKRRNYNLFVKRRNILRESEETIDRLKYRGDKDFSKAVQEHLDKLLSPQEKQFIASQKEWEKRLVRETIKEAALSGAEVVRFPTPYTVSVIEGYISPLVSESTVPYEYDKTKDSLSVGDTITYLENEYIVIETYGENDQAIRVVDKEKADVTEEVKNEILLARRQAVFEEQNKIDDDLYIYKGITVGDRTVFIQKSKLPADKQKSFAEYADLLPEIRDPYDELMLRKEEALLAGIDVDDISPQEDMETIVVRGVNMSLSDWTKKVNNTMDVTVSEDISESELREWATDEGFDPVIIDGRVYEGYTAESLKQPYMYKKVDIEDFDVFTELSEQEQTVVKKYQNITELLRNERIGNFSQIVDEKGFTWYETKISAEEKNSPVIAFQAVAASAPQILPTEKIVNDKTNTAIVLDSRVEILSLPTETEEQSLFDKMDNCGI